MSRIVITTSGSLGDLHPYVAIALGLRERGHEVVVGTSPCYRRKIESLGVGFHPIRPDSDWLTDPDKVRRLSHPRWGLLRVGREWLMPALRESYEDTLAAAEGADLLVAMLATYATRLVAEKATIPWVSAVHIPMGFFSIYDPPLLDFAPVLSKKLRFLGPTFWKPLFWSGKRASRFMARPWYQLRSEIGLPPTTEGNPLADSQSPLLVLALFSKLLADKQPDWPRQTVITGFPFYDDDGQEGLPPSLDRFLNEGPPPIVFTLGSAVSMNAGEFFEQGLNCVKLLNRRAVLIVSSSPRPRVSASFLTRRWPAPAHLRPLRSQPAHKRSLASPRPGLPRSSDDWSARTDPPLAARESASAHLRPLCSQPAPNGAALRHGRACPGRAMTGQLEPIPATPLSTAAGPLPRTCGRFAARQVTNGAMTPADLS
jgi:rhamnosyltransferase subunit B